MIKVKRVYEVPSKQDGLRILVDRLWPRGLQRQQAQVDLWLKGLAPSSALRKWYGHEPEKWREFRRRYQLELKERGDLLSLLRHRASEGNVTLLFAARDAERNNAVALREYLESLGK